jgi:hypothetical protein
LPWMTAECGSPGGACTRKSGISPYISRALKQLYQYALRVVRVDQGTHFPILWEVVNRSNEPDAPPLQRSCFSLDIARRKAKVMESWASTVEEVSQRPGFASGLHEPDDGPVAGALAQDYAAVAMGRLLAGIALLDIEALAECEPLWNAESGIDITARISSPATTKNNRMPAAARVAVSAIRRLALSSK